MRSYVYIFAFFCSLLSVLALVEDTFEFDQNLNNVDFSSYNITEKTKFLIFEVYFGEGFNLKRNVHTRAANLVKLLNDRGEDWILVLPEWRRLFHWKHRHVVQEKIPWGQYFDIKNMNLYVPTMEFHTFWTEIGSQIGIEHLLYLQTHASPGKRSETANKNEFAFFDECTVKKTYYSVRKDGFIGGHFFGRRNEIFAQKLSCVTVKGRSLILADFLKEVPERFIMIDRFEKLQHAYTPHDGAEKSIESDNARRSLVFAKHLREEADKFRAEFLDSNDEKDKTIYHDDDWRLQVKDVGTARGGPYIGVHMRRDDWKRAHGNMFFTVAELADELKARLKEYGLKKVFVATDGTKEEVDELRSYLDKVEVYTYPNTYENVKRFSDGGIPIIDQWITAHARYFIGTYRSTFSQRIHEEREILGFSPATNYNVLCGKQFPKEKCAIRHGKLTIQQKKEKQIMRMKEMQKIRREEKISKTEPKMREDL